jgi:hypothetical protein
VTGSGGSSSHKTLLSGGSTSSLSAGWRAEGPTRAGASGLQSDYRNDTTLGEGPIRRARCRTSLGNTQPTSATPMWPTRSICRAAPRCMEDVCKIRATGQHSVTNRHWRATAASTSWRFSASIRARATDAGSPCAWPAAGVARMTPTARTGHASPASSDDQRSPSGLPNPLLSIGHILPLIRASWRVRTRVGPALGAVAKLDQSRSIEPI